MIHRPELAKALRAVGQHAESRPAAEREGNLHFTVSYFGANGVAVAWIEGKRIYRTSMHVSKKGGENE